MTKAEDLRIVKLYSIVNLQENSSGDIEDIEIAKAVPFFVLAKKTGKTLKVVPTEKLIVSKPIYENVANLHDLIVNKTNKNNRYRKPVHLCSDLSGKEFNKEQLIAFAEQIEKIDADLSPKVSKKLLEDVCLKTSKSLTTSSDMEK